MFPHKFPFIFWIPPMFKTQVNEIDKYWSCSPLMAWVSPSVLLGAFVLTLWPAVHLLLPKKSNNHIIHRPFLENLIL